MPIAAGDAPCLEPHQVQQPASPKPHQVPQTELLAWLQNNVDRKRAPDYHTFVSPDEEMNLAKIGRKINGARYTSAAALLADFQQIHRNACAYNAPGCGRYGGPSEHVPASVLAG